MRKCLGAAVALTWVLAGGVACSGGAGREEARPGLPLKAPPPPLTGTPAPTPDAPPAVAPAPEPVVPARTFTREWVVSASGSDTAEGTREAPFRTIARGLAEVGPGEVLRVLPGTYAERLVLEGKAGRPDAPITVLGEGRPRLVPPGPAGAEVGMVQFRAPHWVFEGFDIDARGTYEFGVAFSGDVQGSTLRGCEVHHGTAGAGVNVYGGARGAVIEGNHIHHFSRGTQDAHGVLVQTTTRSTTVRGNDIHHNSGDSVQCLGPEGFSDAVPADGLLIEDNLLHESQENAVDIKTCHNVVIRRNRMHTFRMAPANQGARGDVVVVHYSARNVRIEDNDLSDAGRGIAVGGNREGPPPSGVVIRGNRLFDMVQDGGMEGSGIRLENSTGTQVVENTFVRLAGPAFIIGHGTGGDTRDLLVRGNRVGAPLATLLGLYAPGLRFEGNVYARGVRFSTRAWGELSLSGWQARGQDVGAQTGEVVLQETSLPTADAAVR